MRTGLRKGELKVRLYVMLTSRDPELLKTWYDKGPEVGTGNDYLTIRNNNNLFHGFNAFHGI